MARIEIDLDERDPVARRRAQPIHVARLTSTQSPVLALEAPCGHPDQPVGRGGHLQVAPQGCDLHGRPQACERLRVFAPHRRRRLPFRNRHTRNQAAAGLHSFGPAD